MKYNILKIVLFISNSLLEIVNKVVIVKLLVNKVVIVFL